MVGPSSLLDLVIDYQRSIIIKVNYIIIIVSKTAKYSDISLSLSKEVMIVVYLEFVLVLVPGSNGHGNFQRLLYCKD